MVARAPWAAAAGSRLPGSGRDRVETVSDVSPGERAVLRIRWFVFDAAARPVAVASVLILMAVVAAMSAALVGASTDQVGGLRNWVFFAQFGFTTEVELGTLIAAVLLVIDSQSGEPFPGQRSMFVVLAVLAGIGAVANIGTIVVYLTDTSVPALPWGTTAEMWAVIITSFLASAVVASTAMWIALSGARLVPKTEGG